MIRQEILQFVHSLGNIVCKNATNQTRREDCRIASVYILVNHLEIHMLSFLEEEVTMPFEYPGRLDITQDDVEIARVLEIPLNPATRNGPNILCIYTGTTTEALKGKSSGQWSRARLTFKLPTDGRKWIKDASRGAGIAPKIVFNGQPQFLRIGTRPFPLVVR